LAERGAEKTEVGEFFDREHRRQKSFATTPLAKVLRLQA
jgi:hypothetical protein